MRSPSPEFSRAEYASRLSAVQREMASRQVDALFVADEPNYRYLTGHFTESWLNRTRPLACWVPAEGMPVLVICEGDEDWARATSWCSDVVTYSGPALGPKIAGVPEIGFETRVPAAVIQAARGIGVSAGMRLAMPTGSRSRVQLSLAVILAVRDELSDCEWADAADLLWTVRIQKSPAEVEYLRRAVAVLDHAVPAAVAATSEGGDERDIGRILRRELFQGGADQVGYTNVVSDLRASLFSGPSDRTFEAGRPFYIDGGAVVNGYWSDYCRLGVVGEPSPEASGGYSELVLALKEGIEAARPGVTAGEVAEAMTTSLGSEVSDGPGIGRMGHGIGLEQPEPPSIHPDDRTPLAAGMVICLEPNAEIPGVGSMVVEEMVVITEDGCEVLSELPTPSSLTQVPRH